MCMKALFYQNPLHRVPESHVPSCWTRTKCEVSGWDHFDSTEWPRMGGMGGRGETFQAVLGHLHTKIIGCQWPYPWPPVWQMHAWGYCAQQKALWFVDCSICISICILLCVCQQIFIFNITHRMTDIEQDINMMILNLACKSKWEGLFYTRKAGHVPVWLIIITPKQHPADRCDNK